jgi:hypothetical protein
MRFTLEYTVIKLASLLLKILKIPEELIAGNSRTENTIIGLEL